MKKVAIWSSLRFTNYGDDLQALAYAMFLKNEGYEVKLFQLDKGLAELYGVETVDTIDELCKDVKLHHCRWWFVVTIRPCTSCTKSCLC